MKSIKSSKMATVSLGLAIHTVQALNLALKSLAPKLAN